MLPKGLPKRKKAGGKSPRFGEGRVDVKHRETSRKLPFERKRVV